MKKLLRYEYHKLLYSYSLVYAAIVCIIAACITNFLIAGAPQSPYVYGVAYEFYVPQIISAAVPTVFIADGIRGGKIKTELLSGEKRYKIFIAKSLICFLAQFIVVAFYLLVLTLLNVKGIGEELMTGENSFVYFLRCASIGTTYCFMLSTVLIFASVLFRNPLITITADIILIIIEFMLKSTIDWRIADRIVPSLMIEQLIQKTCDKFVALNFSLMIVVTTILFYILSLIIYCRKNYK